MQKTWTMLVVMGALAAGLGPVACGDDGGGGGGGGNGGSAGSGGTGGTGGGGGSGGSGCKADSPACGQCFETNCATQAAACEADTACKAGNDAIGGCICAAQSAGNAAAEDACIATMNDINATAAALVTCVRANCSGACLID